MRLDRVFLDSFGSLESRDLTGLEPGLNIVLGPDREHLRTFQDFIRQVLFGFDKDESPLADSLAAPIGGLLEIVHGDGAPLTVERYLRVRGSQTGQVSVSRAGESRPDSEPIRGFTAIGQEAWLEKFVLRSDDLDADRETLLRTALSLLSGSDGADAASARDYFLEEEKRLADATTAARTARQVADERYRRASETFETYATHDEQRADLKRQLVQADIELSVVRARIHRIQALEECRPAWSRMHDIQNSMSDMPRFAFLPQDPLVLLETLKERDRELQAEIDNGDAEDSPRAAELAELMAAIPREFPVEDARKLLAQRDEYAEAVHEIPGLSERMEQSEKRLNEGLARLDREWDAEKLDTVEDSPSVRDRLEKLEASIATQRVESVELAEKSEKSSKVLESARDAATDAARKLEALGPEPELTVEDANARLDVITRAQAETAEYATSREAVSEALEETVDAKPRHNLTAGRLIPLVQLGMSGGFTVVGIVLSVLAFMSGDSALGRTGHIVGATGFIGVLMSLAILEVQRRHTKAQYDASSVLHELAAQTAAELEKDIEVARVQFAYIEEQLRASLDELGLAHDIPLAELDVEQERVRRELERRRTYDETAAELAAANESVDNASWTAEGDAELATESANQLEAMEDDWIDILTSLGLDPELGLTAVRESLDLVGELKQVRSEVAELNIRVPAMRMTVVQVEAGLSEIAELTDLPEFAVHEALPVLEQLKEDREEAARKQDEIGKLRRDGEAWATRRSAIERELETVQRERSELLELVSAEDEASFREIAAREEERRRLSSDLDEIRRGAGHLTGPSGREIEAELQESSPEALEAERDALESRVGRLEELQTRLESRSQELDERLDEMSGPPETLAHRIEMARLDEELAELSRQLITIKTARRLVANAVADYGSGAQETRLRLTGEYLKRLSGGELVDIRPATTDGQSVFGDYEVVSLNGSAEPLKALGEDLARQVLLSSRLAVAHEHAETGEAVPVILDDLSHLLGDDHDRHFAAAIEELSQHTQVLLLASHPAAADRSRDAALGREPRVFDLGLQGRQIRLSA